MAIARSWFQGLRLIWFVSAVVALGLLWSVETQIFVPHPQLQLLLREFAFALIISSLFGLTIEQVQRREFIRLVTEERDTLKRDVFLYAYGFNLPDQIREEIRNSVLNSSFYRENLVMDWEFSSPDNDHMIRVRKKFSYVLINNSNDAKPWRFRFTQIGADDTKAVEETQFHSLRVRKKNGEMLKFGATDIAEELQVDGQPHMKAYSVGLNLEGRERIEIHYEVLQKRRCWGDDKFSCRDMMVGTSTVKLRFPEDSEFEVTVSCKQKPFRQAPDGDPPRMYSFEFEEGMYPHQGIVISWSLKKQTQLKLDTEVVG